MSWHCWNATRQLLRRRTCKGKRPRVSFQGPPEPATCRCNVTRVDAFFVFVWKKGASFGGFELPVGAQRGTHFPMASMQYVRQLRFHPLGFPRLWLLSAVWELLNCWSDGSHRLITITLSFHTLWREGMKSLESRSCNGKWEWGTLCSFQ